MAPAKERPKRAASAIASNSLSTMFVATPGHAPGLLKRSSTQAANQSTMTAQAAPEQANPAFLFVDKDNYVSIAEGRKRTHRAATKKFALASPPRSNSTSTSRTNSIDMTTITLAPGVPRSRSTSTAATSTTDSTEMTTINVAPAPVSKRESPSTNGSMEPPLKRPRYQSEARAPSQPISRPVNRQPTQPMSQMTSPPAQGANIASILHNETLEINRASPRRSPPQVVKAPSSKQSTMSHAAQAGPPNTLPSLTSVLSSDGASDCGINLRPQLPHHLAHSSNAMLGARMSQSSPAPTTYNTGRFSIQPPIFNPLGYSYPSENATPKAVLPSAYPIEGPGPQPYQSDLPSTYPAIHQQPAKSSAEVQHQPPPFDAPPTYPPPRPLRPALQAGADLRQSQSSQPDPISAEMQPHPISQSQKVPDLLSNTNRHAQTSTSNNNSQGPRSDASQLSGTSASMPQKVSNPVTNETKTAEDVQQGQNLGSGRIRPAHLHKDDQEAVVKRLSERNYLNLNSEQDPTPMAHTRVPFSRESPDDQAFIKQVLAVLDKQRGWKSETFGRRQAARIHPVLSAAKPPNDSEALFLSADEAAKWLEPNRFFPGIIVTKGQQPRSLQSTAEFLNEFYDDDAKVDIQDPKVPANEKKGAVPRKVTIGELKERFLGNRKTQKKNQPWNCLELATHVEDGLRPAFLGGEDCRLLTKLKLPSTEDKAGRRGYDPGWKEVETWALLAQAGALTEPHQDSHGYNTYITVNQGVIGFGFLANPSAEERAQWRENSHAFNGGQWRYVILRPGQTVYFPSGTVHFVFRLAAEGDTLAFGGHVLRNSQIVRWIKTLIEEQADPNVTNEDLTVSAPAYLDRAEKFVRQALKDKRVEIWGGKESIEEFLVLKKQFEKNKKELDKNMG